MRTACRRPQPPRRRADYLSTLRLRLADPSTMELPAAVRTARRHEAHGPVREKHKCHRVSQHAQGSMTAFYESLASPPPPPPPRLSGHFQVEPRPLRRRGNAAARRFIPERHHGDRSSIEGSDVPVALLADVPSAGDGAVQGQSCFLREEQWTFPATIELGRDPRRLGAVNETNRRWTRKAACLTFAATDKGPARPAPSRHIRSITPPARSTVAVGDT